MPTILLVGEDDLLLETRAAVLRTTGALTVCCKPLAALDLLGGVGFDLAILCHSIPERLCLSLARAMRVQSPGIRILRVASARMWESPEESEAVNAVSPADPEHLVFRSIQLLATRTLPDTHITQLHPLSYRT